MAGTPSSIIRAIFFANKKKYLRLNDLYSTADAFIYNHNYRLYNP